MTQANPIRFQFSCRSQCNPVRLMKPLALSLLLLGVSMPSASFATSFLEIHAENRARTEKNKDGGSERIRRIQSNTRRVDTPTRKEEQAGGRTTDERRSASTDKDEDEKELNPLRLQYPGSQIPNYGTDLTNRYPITDDLRQRYREMGIDIDNLPEGQQFLNGYIIDHKPYKFEEKDPTQHAFTGFGIASGGVGSNDEAVAEWRKFVQGYYPGKYDTRDPEIGRWVRMKLRAPAPFKPIEFEPFDQAQFTDHFLDFIGFDEIEQLQRVDAIEKALLESLAPEGPDNHAIGNIKGSYALDKSRLTDTRKSGNATERSVNVGEIRRAKITMIADESSPQTGDFERWVEHGWLPVEQDIIRHWQNKDGQTMVEMQVVWQATESVKGVPR